MSNNKKEDYLQFEDILLDALDFAREIGQAQWAGFILTTLAAIQENLDEEFALVCEAFLRKTAEDKKEKEQLLPFHFAVNRMGST